MEREDTPPSLPDPRGQLQTREEILSQCASFLKKTASWKSHESAVKATRLGFGSWLGIQLLNRCLSLVDNLKLQRPTNHPWHPKVFWFLPCFFVFPTGNRFGWQLDFFGMSVYICHHDLGRHPECPNQNQPVSELCLASLANMLWTSLRWKSWNPSMGFGHLQIMVGFYIVTRWDMTAKFEMEWLCINGWVSGQRCLHLLGGFKYFLFSPLLGEVIQFD